MYWARNSHALYISYKCKKLNASPYFDAATKSYRACIAGDDLRTEIVVSATQGLGDLYLSNGDVLSARSLYAKTLDLLIGSGSDAPPGSWRLILNSLPNHRAIITRLGGIRNVLIAACVAAKFGFKTYAGDYDRRRELAHLSASLLTCVVNQTCPMHLLTVNTIPKLSNLQPLLNVFVDSWRCQASTLAATVLSVAELLVKSDHPWLALRVLPIADFALGTSPTVAARIVIIRAEGYLKLGLIQQSFQEFACLGAGAEFLPQPFKLMCTKSDLSHGHSIKTTAIPAFDNNLPIDDEMNLKALQGLSQVSLNDEVVRMLTPAMLPIFFLSQCKSLSSYCSVRFANCKMVNVAHKAGRLLAELITSTNFRDLSTIRFGDTLLGRPISSKPVNDTSKIISNILLVVAT